MARIWRDSELSLSPLAGKRVALLGYGSQGKAQALNLRDSGIAPVIGVRPGMSQSAAQSDGFSVVAIREACEGADIAIVLLPENAHAGVFAEHINPSMNHGRTVVFAHGYTALYKPGVIRDDLQRLLVAPKAVGPQLRALYEAGSGAAALVSAEPGDIEIAKALAMALGCGRAAIIESSFREETETDLFGEQAVLCGGMPALAMAAFETLVEAGYDPLAAYYECLFEIRLIAEMMVAHGLAGMIDRISDTAKFGAMVAGPQLVTDSTRSAMRGMLTSIRLGDFFRAAEAEAEAGAPNVVEWREAVRKHGLDRAKAQLDLK
jgi:ketol-acid reductoisomerase